MDFLPLIIIPVIYLGVAMLKPYVQTKIPFKLCAICVAVSLSWLALLILWKIGYNVSMVSTSTLMGMSISGLMYKAENFYKEKSIRNFWLVRLFIVIGGLYAVFFLLSKEWNLLFFVLSFLILGIAAFSLLFQDIKHRDVLKEQKQAGRDSSLIKKLEDCC